MMDRKALAAAIYVELRNQADPGPYVYVDKTDNMNSVEIDGNISLLGIADAILRAEMPDEEFRILDNYGCRPLTAKSPSTRP